MWQGVVLVAEVVLVPLAVVALGLLEPVLVLELELELELGVLVLFEEPVL